MSRIKQLAGDTALYGLGSIVPRALNFLLLPLHTRSVFSSEEYGVVTTLYGFAAFFNIVYLFGMETAYFRFASQPQANRDNVFRAAISCVLLISVPLSALLIVFREPLAAYAYIAHHPEFVVWVVLTLLVDALVAIPFAQLRQQRQPWLFASAKILNVLVQLGLNYYFLKVDYDPSIGIGYVFLANLLANSLYLLFFVPVWLRWRPLYERTLSPKMLRYAYPVMLTGLAGMVNEMAPRTLMEWFLPAGTGAPGVLKATGILGVAYKYAVLMGLAVQAFRFAAEPFFFAHAADKNSPELFARVNHYFVITGCSLLVVVGANLEWLQLFTGPSFYEGLWLVPWLLLAYLLLGIYYNVSVWFKITDKTHYGTWITLAGALVTILGNALLVPQLGYAGSAYAAVLCYLVMLVLCYLSGQRHHPIPYRVWADSLYVIGTLAWVLVLNHWAWPSRLLTTAVHGAGIVAWAAVVYWLERKELRHALSGRK
ncbi:MAG: oligosaccharide flippase family protein [Cyclobacteriaceae bacterium]|jgi:O-antigen/teichoic acid export membrane protein|nr:oligosaccharide flippase family protein [Cyclobacteriaceae bacterium]